MSFIPTSARFEAAPSDGSAADIPNINQEKIDIMRLYSRLADAYVTDPTADYPVAMPEFNPDTAEDGPEFFILAHCPNLDPETQVLNPTADSTAQVTIVTRKGEAFMLSPKTQAGHLALADTLLDRSPKIGVYPRLQRGLSVALDDNGQPVIDLTSGASTSDAQHFTITRLTAEQVNIAVEESRKHAEASKMYSGYSADIIADATASFMRVVATNALPRYNTDPLYVLARVADSRHNDFDPDLLTREVARTVLTEIVERAYQSARNYRTEVERQIFGIAALTAQRDGLLEISASILSGDDAVQSLVIDSRISDLQVQQSQLSSEDSTRQIDLVQQIEVLNERRAQLSRSMSAALSQDARADAVVNAVALTAAITKLKGYQTQIELEPGLLEATHFADTIIGQLGLNSNPDLTKEQVNALKDSLTRLTKPYLQNGETLRSARRQPTREIANLLVKQKPVQQRLRELRKHIEGPNPIDKAVLNRAELAGLGRKLRSILYKNTMTIEWTSGVTAEQLPTTEEILKTLRRAVVMDRASINDYDAGVEFDAHVQASMDTADQIPEPVLQGDSWDSTKVPETMDTEIIILPLSGKLTDAQRSRLRKLSSIKQVILVHPKNLDLTSEIGFIWQNRTPTSVLLDTVRAESQEIKLD